VETSYFFVLRVDVREKWRWSFYGPRGHHLAVSGESYATEQECREAIAALTSRTRDAAISIRV
jgi:uncharacterized protein YegP (UPF0339 family)